jgi:hypothetical protein
MTDDTLKTKQERFLRLVQKDEQSGCWLWIGGKQPAGYGIFSYGTKKEGSKLAHRTAYEFWKGPIPTRVWVLHTCRNKCVNPDHLELGSAKKNNLDDKIRDNSLLIGSRNPAAKYTEDHVREIRRRYGEGETQTSISKSLGIKQGHISDICLRKVWKCVE